MQINAKITYVWDKPFEKDGRTFYKHYAKVEDDGLKFIAFSGEQVKVGDKCIYKLTNYIPPYDKENATVRTNNLRLVYIGKE